MYKRKAVAISIGVAAIAIVGAVGYQVQAVHAESTANVKKVAEAPVVASAPTTTEQTTTTAQAPSTTEQATPATPSTDSMQNDTNVNPIQLDTPGPIQHYLWLHNGESDEVWQHVQQGLWRIVSTMQDGSTQKGIYKNGYLYLMHYNADGKLLGAEKIAQPTGYDGKQSVFDGMKQNLVGAKAAGEAKYNNVSVHVLQKTTPGAMGSESTTIYVDTVHNLPVKAEHVVNGTTTTETWSYSYVQQDDTLFQLPTSVTFEDAPAADVPTHK